MFNLFFAVIEAIDPTTSSILGLVGSLGSAGAAVVVVWMFLSAWRTNADKQDMRYEELIKSIEARCERQDTRYESLARDLKDVIRDNSFALHRFIGIPPREELPK